MIKGTITGQKLCTTQTVMADRTIGYLTAEFTFSPDWEGADIWAHFFQSEDKPFDFELVDGKITPDKQLNLSSGEWGLYLHGSFPSGKRITTTISKINVRECGILNGEPLPIEPPSVGEQILKTANEAKEIAQSVRDEADAGGFDGFSPVVETAPAAGGNNVSITDKQGVKTFFIKDGKDYDHSEEFTNLAAQVREDARTSGVNAANAAQDASNAMQHAADANTYKTAAETAKTEAEGFSSSASGYADAAKLSEQDAQDSMMSAMDSADDAKTYAQSASSNALTASDSATLAGDYARAANASANNAKTSEDNAKTSETNAKTSEDNAKTSETNAGTSATNSENSAVRSEEAANSINGIYKKEVTINTKPWNGYPADYGAYYISACINPDLKIFETEFLTRPGYGLGQIGFRTKSNCNRWDTLVFPDSGYSANYNGEEQGNFTLNGYNGNGQKTKLFVWNYNKRDPCNYFEFECPVFYENNFIIEATSIGQNPVTEILKPNKGYYIGTNSKSKITIYAAPKAYFSNVIVLPVIMYDEFGDKKAKGYSNYSYDVLLHFPTGSNNIGGKVNWKTGEFFDDAVEITFTNDTVWTLSNGYFCTELIDAMDSDFNLTGEENPRVQPEQFGGYFDYYIKNSKFYTKNKYNYNVANWTKSCAGDKFRYRTNTPKNVYNLYELNPEYSDAYTKLQNLMNKGFYISTEPNSDSFGKIVYEKFGDFGDRPNYKKWNWLEIRNHIRDGSFEKIVPLGTEFLSTNCKTGEKLTIKYVRNNDSVYSGSFNNLSPCALFVTKEKVGPDIDGFSNGGWLQTREAFISHPTKISQPGTYKFIGNDGATLMFTLTQPGATIMVFDWNSGPSIGGKLVSYAKAEDVPREIYPNPYKPLDGGIETVTLEADNGAAENISLDDGILFRGGDMCINNAPKNVLNYSYGSCEYVYSDVRKWLTNSVDSGYKWHQVGRFDLPPAWAGKTYCFPDILPDDLKLVISPCNIRCRNAYNSDIRKGQTQFVNPETKEVYNKQYKLADKYFILSTDDEEYYYFPLDGNEHSLYRESNFFQESSNIDTFKQTFNINRYNNSQKNSEKMRVGFIIS